MSGSYTPRPSALLRPAKEADYVGPNMLVFGPYVPGGRSGWRVHETGVYATVAETPDSEGWFKVVSPSGRSVILNRERILVMSDPTDLIYQED